MQSAQEARTQKEGTWLLPIAVMLSLIWIVAFPLFLEAAEECDGATAASGYIERHFGCLPPNAVGDLFAGAAAPLAFIWLVTAVLIQARELRAQRQELYLTREEYKLSRVELEETRGVLKAQADEARRNVEYVGEQTRIMAAERKERAQEAAWQLFRAKLEVIWEPAFEVLKSITLYEKYEISDRKSYEVESKIDPVKTHEAYDSIRLLKEKLVSLIPHLERGRFSRSAGDIGPIHAFAMALDEALMMRSQLNEPRQIELARHGVDVMPQLLAELYRLLQRGRDQDAPLAEADYDPERP